MNKNKGFTLIELLAVIVILAIIALVVLPIIKGLIDDTKKKSFKNSAYGIVRAGEILYSNNMMNGTAEEVTFTYTNGVETSSVEGKTLDYNGTKPKSGSVVINSEGQVAIALHNGTYCVEKDYEESKVTLSNKREEECTIVVWAWTYTDSDSSSTVNIGDEITFGTESFYVISNDGTNIKALAKYNLYVGGTYNTDNGLWTAYGDEATGLQDSIMKGYSLEKLYNGVTAFSSDTVKGTNYNDYVGSIVEGYVNTYKTKLEELGATINSAALITKGELKTLGCSGSTCIGAPIFVYLTSYWTGSADNTIYNNCVWFVYSSGYFFYSNFLSYSTYYGVRPVITISSSEI